ncbi:hypothetical protein AVANS14531_02945 [Campylobacter sp. Cr9]|uniref:tetratricopeptide repeat protein n=1 Tax=Campylobacter sp. Cr9 TaxID=2735728 RepID=UPI0030141F26|nr:hypothetical protein [Campylobacter sp. Cr9]
MKKLLLLCSFVYLYSFELFINTGKEANKDISVLHIKNNTDITCDDLHDENLKQYIKCSVKGKSRLLANQDLSLFKLEFQNKKDKLDIYIYPKTNVSIINSEQKLYENNIVFSSNKNKSKNYTFVFYQYPQGHLSPNGLDFDVIFPDLKTPFIEGLDLDQNPVNISDNSDINAYLSIKKYYDNKQYKELLDLCNTALEKYKNSVFISEFYLYRIRAMFNLLNVNTSLSEEIITSAKNYIRIFPSDENYAEILQMMIKTYLKLEQRSDAEYFIDILNNEHPNSYYTKLASLNYADFLLSHGKRDAATIIYNNILFSSDDAVLASKAAISLAKININHNKAKEAKEFVLKVFNANEQFLLEDKEKTLALADDFYKEKMYDISAPIYEFLFKNSSKLDNYYERILKNLAVSLAKNNDYKKADEYLNEYKKIFPNGEYMNVIDETIDSLYFEKEEKDSFKLHEYYNFLMAKYDNNISKRALYEEVKLLFKEQDYEKILKLEDKIKDSENEELINLYKESLIKLLNIALNNDDCDDVLNYIKNYHFVSDEFIINKKKYLECLDRKKEKDLALDFALKFENEDLVFYRIQQAKILYIKQNYKEVEKTIHSILNKRFKIKNHEYFDAYYYLSLALLKQNKYNDAIFALKQLEKYGKGLRLVEVYDEFLEYFKRHNLDISTINYGMKAIDIQNYLGVNLYSPKIEFITIDALINKNRLKEAKEILVDLYKLKLSDDEFSYAKYQEARILIEQKEFMKAKEALKECRSGEWKNLCDEKLQVLE